MHPEQMASVIDSVKRGRAGHAYGAHDGKFVMAIGSPNAVQIPGGFAICVGISREQGLDLKARLDEYLSTGK